MPTIQPQANATGASQRGTFRPPWVKEGPPALPMPSSAPWMRSRELRSSRDEGQTTAVSQELQAARDRLNAVEPAPAPSASKPEPAPIRRLSKITIVPAAPAENGKQPVKREVHSKPTEPEPKAEPTKTPVRKPAESEPKAEPKQGAKAKAAAKDKVQDGATKTTGAREKRIPVETAKEKTEPVKEKQKPTPVPVREKSKTPEEPVRVKPKTPVEPAKAKTEPAKAKPEPAKAKTEPVALKRERTRDMAKPPPPPPAPPAPPPPPPMAAAILGADYKPPTVEKVAKIEALKSRPRRRPDWGTMMKEIESVRKLNHVVCNDRSSPLLATPIKVKEQFMYESEKPNVHNRLLDQIQSGVQLKRVKTNDRSRPILDGLRKFRRQMTIEEQSQKADAESVIAEQDELDDIDKVRDDLQSTKQMLALELRNKEAMDRENKKLLARLLNLEVELEKERAAKQQDQNPQSQRLEEEKETRKLKAELTEVQKVADDMESKYHETSGQLELTRGELEDVQRKNQILEKRLANYASRDADMPLMKQMSSKKLAAAKSASKVDMAHHTAAPPEEEEESEYEEETETESEEDSSDEEDKEALQEKRTARELKLLSTKLKSFKDKEETAKKERVSLRDQLKKLTAMLKEEKKKYKVLQKEVDSMASVLKEDEDEESEEEEEEESESESESESEASDQESDGDLPPERSSADKKQNLTVRAKRHETTLTVLKKGNYMLKANVDRIKDDLFKQKEMAITLQEDLNAVLAELG